MGAGEQHARAVYDKATSARLGVSIDAVCHAGGRTYARVMRPLNEDAAARFMFPDGLKLSIPVDNLHAEVVGPLASRSLEPLAALWPDDHEDIEA